MLSERKDDGMHPGIEQFYGTGYAPREGEADFSYDHTGAIIPKSWLGSQNDWKNSRVGDDNYFPRGGPKSLASAQDSYTLDPEDPRSRQTVVNKGARKRSITQLDGSYEQQWDKRNNWKTQTDDVGACKNLTLRWKNPKPCKKEN